MYKKSILAGSIHAFLSVALGAFGAHVVKDRITAEMMATYQTATDYQMYHAIALLIVGLVGLHIGERATIRYAGRLFNIGIIVFSGSLYLYVWTGLKWLGAITPIGGVAFLAGWICLILSLRKK